MSEQKVAEPAFLQLSELASNSSGGRVLFATDDWFAPAEWMLMDAEPVFIPDKYTPYGKWMDGWETRRKRIAGHDWCIIRLAALSKIKGIVVDTAHFTGNFAPRFSVQGAQLSPLVEESIPERGREMIGTACSEKDLEKVASLKSDEWSEVIEMTPLKPGYSTTSKQYFFVDCNDAFTHLRVNIYPDGGIARLRVFGEVQPDNNLLSSGSQLDLIGMLNGGQCLSYSNAHYGHPRNLIKPNRGINMGDGWETARRLDRPPILNIDKHGILQVPGCEWAVFRLCSKGIVERVVVDTNHFKGNFPDTVKIEATCLEPNRTLQSAQWQPMLDSTKLAAHREHVFEDESLQFRGPCSHVRITIAPDGGISRVRLFGRVL
ncbi:allantoicase-like [Topomyia yanbarensis]|uniref:allantoicase-like n=1 Tax=Topomyia yanbarensis TaxID=2498891 RepID=UPI00273AEE60|nr:allantoicase-like [Topomyia yanbarensis]